MADELRLYTFEKADGSIATHWTTMDYQEAQEYAQKYGYIVYEHTYAWQESEQVGNYSTKDDEAQAA